MCIHRQGFSNALISLTTPAQAILLKAQNLMRLWTKAPTNTTEKGRRREGTKWLNFSETSVHSYTKSA